MDRDTSALVSTEWLNAHLNAPDIRIVDASWHMPSEERSAFQEYQDAHIENAVFFDIDQTSDEISPYPHMLPGPEKFASTMQKLGLGNGLRIIVYDNSKYRSATRLWWMLRIFGHKDVAVLDGGLQKWISEGRKLASGTVSQRERHFTVQFDQTMLRSRPQIEAKLGDKSAQIIDARSPGRFSGQEAEPRPGMRSGHIPGSFNVYYADLYEDDGRMKSPEDLNSIFLKAGVDLQKPITTSCGSGITACVLALALEQIGHKDVSIYDGSWSEWGHSSKTPIETGKAQ